MKKLTALLLSILLVMTLFAGCTNTGGNDTPSGGDGQTTTPPAGGDQPRETRRHRVHVVLSPV